MVLQALPTAKQRYASSLAVANHVPDMLARSPLASFSALQDEDSAATAAREFAEETLGLFGDCGVDAASVVRQRGGTVLAQGAPALAWVGMHAKRTSAAQLTCGACCFLRRVTCRRWRRPRLRLGCAIPCWR